MNLAVGFNPRLRAKYFPRRVATIEPTQPDRAIPQRRYVEMGSRGVSGIARLRVAGRVRGVHGETGTGGSRMNRTTTTQPLTVSTGTKQSGEIYERWPWVEVAVRTPRMLTALETGIKGGKWFSLNAGQTGLKALSKLVYPLSDSANWHTIRASLSSRHYSFRSQEVF